jgi:hypothetical protein
MVFVEQMFRTQVNTELGVISLHSKLKKEGMNIGRTPHKKKEKILDHTSINGRRGEARTQLTNQVPDPEDLTSHQAPGHFSNMI